MSEATNPAESNLALLTNIYCSIMDAVEIRLQAITKALATVESNPQDPDNWRHAEFCYLQVRKCVEYVALALLAVHRENTYECEALENAYKADVIFNELAKLNKHGFPKAIQIELNQQCSGQHHIDPVPILSKRRMKRIYDGCAVHLHAGNLTNIIDQTLPPYDLTQIVVWRDELKLLLSQHQVMLPHLGLIMIAWLKEPDSGKSRVIFAKAQGPFQIQGDTAVFNGAEQQ